MQKITIPYEDEQNFIFNGAASSVSGMQDKLSDNKPVSKVGQIYSGRDQRELGNYECFVSRLRLSEGEFFSDSRFKMYNRK